MMMMMMMLRMIFFFLFHNNIFSFSSYLLLVLKQQNEATEVCFSFSLREKHGNSVEVLLIYSQVTGQVAEWRYAPYSHFDRLLPALLVYKYKKVKIPTCNQPQFLDQMQPTQNEYIKRNSMAYSSLYINITKNI